MFVTLRIGGSLRGCMGELEARHDDLVAETADRALAAALGDPRFPPLEADELPLCHIDVTVLGPLEEVSSSAALDPAVFGIEVSDTTGRRAVLLPDLEGVETAEQQVELTRRKAGIPEGTPLSLRHFRATRVTIVLSRAATLFATSAVLHGLPALLFWMQVLCRRRS